VFWWVTVEKINPKIIASIQSALRIDKRTLEEIAALVGCSLSTVNQVKSGARSPGSYTIRFCEVLSLNPFSGEPLTGRKIIGKVIRSAKVEEKPATYNSLNGTGVIEIPDEITLTEDECRTILEARSCELKPEFIKVMLMASGENQALADTVAELFKGNYGRAIEMMGRLMQNGGKK
jgi:hypothetical protein